MAYRTAAYKRGRNRCRHGQTKSCHMPDGKPVEDVFSALCVVGIGIGAVLRGPVGIVEQVNSAACQ